MAKIADSVNNMVDTVADKLGMGVRGKLLTIFIVVKVIPLILIALLAWYQITQLGTSLREQAVNDSVSALNHGAVENIERMTTSIADEVATFLYGRDADITFLATIKPEMGDYSLVEQHYRAFIESNTGQLVSKGRWELAPDGMSWVDIIGFTDPSEVISTNPENDDVINGAGFHYRPPDNNIMEYVPYYDEIVFYDTDLRERVKVVAPNSTKTLHPFSSELKDVSDKENTYVGSETFADKLEGLQPGEIYVSDVIGSYVPSHYVGMYTPKRMAITAIDAEINKLQNQSFEDQYQYGLFMGKLKSLKEKEIPALLIEGETDAEICEQTNKAIVGLLEDFKQKITAEYLVGEIDALQDTISAITFNPEQEAYAGAENPNGVRFEGIVRWITPVYDDNGDKLGYVSFALNHDFIMEYVDHVTPMEERYTALPNAFAGNYAFIWDYQCRSIAHPRHHSIVGYDELTGLEQIPWLETSIYEELLSRAGGAELADLEAAWPSLINTPQPLDTTYIGALDLLPDIAVFDDQSRSKKPAPALTKAGYVGLDGRYLNNAPQCTGWMDLTQNGGSGSFYILWSGVNKLTTAAAIPYYTGQYAPSEENGYSRRGFAMVTIGAGLEDFERPAEETGKNLKLITSKNLTETSFKLVTSTGVLILIVIIIAIWLANTITGNLRRLIEGVSRFRSGQRQFRFNTKQHDEFGVLSDSFDDMADSVVASVSSPMSIVDENRNIIYMNSAGLTYLGKTLEDVVGEPYALNSIYSSNSEADPIRAHLEDRNASVLRVGERYYHGVATDFFDKDGKKVGYYVITTDITEIQQAREKAEQASAAKTAFLSNMSHEMRTPLNAVIGMTSIGKASTESEKKDYCFDKIDNASTHLLGVINDILDISKIEANKLTLSPLEFNLHAMLQRVISVISFRVEEKHQNFQLIYDEALPATIVADDQRLFQVITNLIANAVKFTEEQGSITLAVNLSAKEGTMAQVHFAIIDNGIGMTHEQSERIFAPFEQAENSTTRSYGGTGLGLSISRNIVDMMGGELTVASELGLGSTFEFTIEAEIGLDSLDGEKNGLSVQKSVPVNPDEINFEEVSFAGHRILLTEDIEVNREIVLAMLEPTGITIDIAANGQEAVDMFRANPDAYELIFMDVQMPVLDGREATRTIRAFDFPKAKEIPIVAMTANVFREEVEEYLAVGMTDHIGKPIDYRVVIAVLYRYLDNY
jgi:PAS domain S-box-containing protein